jgi:hypothetical protein
MAMTVKNAVLWDVTPCGACKNRCFGGTYCLHHQVDNRQGRNNVSSPILVTLMMEAIHSSETYVLTRAT